VQEIVAERLTDLNGLGGDAPGLDGTRALEHNYGLRLLQQQLRLLADALARGWLLARPIAIVTTCGADGSINGAPYSFFVLLSHDPAVIAIGVLPHPEGRMKDTGVKVLATHEFVVNLVSEEMAEAMNLTCIDAPPGIDELRLADLPTTPMSSPI